MGGTGVCVVPRFVESANWLVISVSGGQSTTNVYYGADFDLHCTASLVLPYNRRFLIASRCSSVVVDGLSILSRTLELPDTPKMHGERLILTPADKH